MPQFSALWGDALTTELGTNDTSVLFTDARRKHAVNEGYRQFADLTECFVKRSTVTVSSSAQEFNLNSTSVLPGGDFLRVSGEAPVYRKTDTAGNTQDYAGDESFPQRDIAWLDSAESGWRSTVTGDPAGWYLRRDGGALYFGLDRPADVSTSETAELIIPYVALPSSMTSDTAVPFAVSTNYRTDLTPYHQGMVHYAAHLLEKMRRDKQAAQEQLQLFLGYVSRYLAVTRPKGPRSVRAARSYFKQARVSEGERSLRAPWWR